ncbi:DUF420 domain-containing protein [Flavobacterium aurantiibacter]|uniref:DUF420 domain-containing protein n=1 Tax=Flavobacterium aurantiibacter TaxID=2023067 RepID=A0A255ZP67_9FLAO|nr:DUF420 domain-containing protein [Flavobacterium aurantiibacter]OYQ43303.1 hypothetical protein CHX27_10410 [Flavobacterium aurantiibacter]
MENTSAEKKYNIWIAVLSIAIPVVVALLFSVKLSDFGIHVKPFSFLPPIYAGINGLTAVLLVTAVFAIKNGNRTLHERLMKTAIACSVAFLGMYVAYHSSAESTNFGDTNHDQILSEAEIQAVGFVRYVYYFILLTHIALSVIIIPFVLLTYVRAISNNFARHKALAKITFPMWLYVAVTGVIIYLMISPYYAN